MCDGVSSNRKQSKMIIQNSESNDDGGFYALNNLMGDRCAASNGSWWNSLFIVAGIS